MTLVFPTPAQAALQTPVNTFSPTSSPLQNTSNPNTYTFLPLKALWVITSTGAVSSVAVSAPLISTGGQNPTISIGAASTGASGAVQLNDSTSSASTTQAATANAVRQAASLATSAIPCSAILAKGSILTGTAPNTPTALAVGTNGQFLVACSTAPEGICWLTLSSGSGTVTSVDTGTGLTGGPITTSGTIALANTAVTPGSYTFTNLTVDAQGRITAASSGSAPSGGTVTSITAGTGLNGGTITSIGTIDLADTAVTAGSYTNGSFTVDAQGRLTSASSGTAPVTSVSGTAPIVSSGGATPAISLADTAVVSGSYTYASFTVDAKGRLTAASSGTAPSTTVTAPITNGGTAVAPVIGIQAASTTQSGAVQLNDTVTSTSVVEALTAAQGKNLQDQINALTITSNLTFAGTFDATTSQMLSVTSAGTDAGFTVGADLPAADTSLLDYFVIVTTGGSYSPPGGGGPYTATQGDWFLCDGSAWQYLNVGPDVPTASTTAAGIVELSTNAETQTGTNANLAVTPASLQSKVSDSVSTTSSSTIASSTAVKTAYDLAAAAVPCSAFTAKGGVLAGTGAGTYEELALSATDGEVLTVDSACTNGVKWATSTAPAATPICEGTVYGCTTLISATGNTALGHCAAHSLTTGAGNAALGYNSGCSLTSGCSNTLLGGGAGCGLTTGKANQFIGANAGFSTVSGCCNVAIGVALALPVADGSCQLALGWKGAGSAMCYWLTGDNTKAIKPGAGIIDCAGCCGTAGQVLSSTGANAVEWSNGPNAGCAMARNASGQNLTSLASYAPLTIKYCTAVTDSTSWYNSTTGVFAPTVEGWYQVTAGARIFAGACENVLSLLCNATVISTNGGYNFVSANVSAVAYMNGTTDAMCVQIRNNTGGCLMGQSESSRFSAVLVALP